MSYDVYVSAPELNAIIRTDMHSDRMNIPSSKLTVLGYTGNGYLIYAPHGLTVGLWKSSDWSFVRSSAWAAYAATPRDFDFPPGVVKGRSRPSLS